MRRIELLTPCLQGRCSPSWATPPNFHWYFVKTASAYECIAFVVFPCLNENCSHSVYPYLVLLILNRLCFFGDCRVCWYAIEPKNNKLSKLVGLSGLEPPTSRLSGVRSNRLSYRPIGSMLDSNLFFPHFTFNILYSMFITSFASLYIEK